MYERKIKVKVSEKDMCVIIPVSFIRNNYYTVNEKIIYSYLKSYGINSNLAFPSIETIKDDLGLSKPTVIKIIRSLEDKKGLIIRKGKRGTKENNVYYLTAIDNLYGIFNDKDFKKNKELAKILAD